MFNKIKNFFGRFDSDVSCELTDPLKKPWESPALMTYLKDYPNNCSMKNYKALEILRDNRKLTKDIEVLEFTSKYFDKNRKQDIEELLNSITEMSALAGEIANEEAIYRIMNKYGYEFSEDGSLIKKGELD